MAVTRNTGKTTLAKPLPVMKGSRTSDPRGLGEMGTKGIYVEEGLDMAKRYHVGSSQRKQLEEETLHSKRVNLKSTRAGTSQSKASRTMLLLRILCWGLRQVECLCGVNCATRS